MATLAISCGKDKDNARLRILAENMSGSSAKVLVDPANFNAASWVENETIDLNGTLQDITGNETDGFSIDLGDDNDAPANPYAVYPGTSFNNNDLEVTNSIGTGEVVLNRLAISFDGTGKHHVIFPMVATPDTYNSSNRSLLFKHLTAAFKMTLVNGTSDPINLASVKIIAQSEEPTMSSNVSNIPGYTARWTVQGPAVPTGDVGSNTTDMTVSYSSEMNFDLKSGTDNYVTINNGTPLSFCVPVTISSVRYLTIVGYKTDGTEMFQIHKDLCPAAGQDEIDIERNKMYIIPNITINND